MGQHSISDLDKIYDELSEELDELSEKLTSGLIDIENKLLDQALKEQVNMEMGMIPYIEAVHYFNEYCKSELERIFSENYEEAINHRMRAYSATEAKQVAMANEDYIAMRRVSNKIKSLHERMKYIQSVVETRKYTLKTLSDTVINGVNKHII